MVQVPNAFRWVLLLTACTTQASAWATSNLLGRCSKLQSPFVVTTTKHTHLADRSNTVFGPRHCRSTQLISAHSVLTLRAQNDNEPPGQGALSEIIYRPGRTSDGPGLVDLSLEAFDSGGWVGSLINNVELALQGTNLRTEVEGGLSRRMMMLDVSEDGEDAESGVSADESTEKGPERSKYALYVAEERQTGKMVGMVELGVLPCPVPLKRRPAPEMPYLVNLAVSRDFRRQGIARALIAECERVAEEEWWFGEMFLHVKSNNRAARALYASMGFVCEFQEPMWYRLKNGQQKLRRNPRLFLRKVFASALAAAPSAQGAGDAQEDRDQDGGGGSGREGKGRAYVWGNDP